MMDINKIVYSIPTISDDLPELEAARLLPGESPLSFHEDSWSQIEFLTAGYLPELQRMLKEYKSFEQANRLPDGKFGWRKIYIRKISRNPLITAVSPLQQLETLLAVKATSAPILTTASSVSGRVKNGFTLPLGGNVYLYGYAANQDIPVLGALLGDSSDHTKLAESFIKLNAAHGLVLVDWRAQMVLTSVTSDGFVDVWRP